MRNRKRMWFSTLGVALTGALAGPVSQAELPAALGDVDGKVVLVDFWASWCAPCRRSFPWMNSMQQKYGSEGLTIVAVNVDKERDLATQFLEETPAHFDIRYDPAGNLAAQFNVQAMPSSFLLDADGKVLATHFGFKTADAASYEEHIRTALGETSHEE